MNCQPVTQSSVRSSCSRFVPHDGDESETDSYLWAYGLMDLMDLWIYGLIDLKGLMDPWTKWTVDCK